MVAEGCVPGQPGDEGRLVVHLIHVVPVRVEAGEVVVQHALQAAERHVRSQLWRTRGKRTACTCLSLMEVSSPYVEALVGFGK